MKNYYTAQSVYEAVGKLEEMGYEIVTIEGCLLDSYIAIAPDEQHYHYIFRETYLNEWSSAYTVRRYSRLPKWALAEIKRIESEVYA